MDLLRPSHVGSNCANATTARAVASTSVHAMPAALVYVSTTSAIASATNQASVNIERSPRVSGSSTAPRKLVVELARDLG